MGPFKYTHNSQTLWTQKNIRAGGEGGNNIIVRFKVNLLTIFHIVCSRINEIQINLII